MTLFLGVVVIFLAIFAVYRRVDVRLALLGAALALAFLAGDPSAVVRVFLETFSNERFVVPICTAMGFAYVLRYTGCDRHLVHLLLRPVRRVRALLVPGTVLIGFLVNIPVISQTSTAVTLGAVAIPLLLAARIPPLTVGAALLLGSSIGGELLNPGAPELRTTVEESEKAARQERKPSPGLTGAGVVARIAPLNFLGLGVATVVFCALSARRRAGVAQDGAGGQGEPGTEYSVLSTSSPVLTPLPNDETREQPPTAPKEPPFKVNLVMALIPLLPLALLFLTAPPLRAVRVPPSWLVELPRLSAADAVSALAVAPPAGLPATPPWPGLAANLRPPEARLPAHTRGLFDSRLIGMAMLIGVVAAALAVWRKAPGIAGAFFEGAGYGFTHIISLIVAATCFGKGVEAIGLASVLGGLIEQAPWLLLPAAGAVPLGFAVLCGSGMATTQSLFPFFAVPALRMGIDPGLVGAVVSLAAAAGRTMSPVAAVTLMSGELTGTDPLALARRVALPLLAGVTAVVLAAIFVASGG
jgi:DcuC family C4-dicarboxylate transporter